jgi:hypothetical protein
MKAQIQQGILLGIIAAGAALAADLPGIKDLPDIKEGLWESSTFMPGVMEKPMLSKMCTSNAVNRKMYEDTHNSPNAPCKELHAEHHDSVYISESECNFSGKISHSKSVMTLTGNTGFRLEMRKADNTVETVIESKWVGSCPTGMKLGDVTGPDGKVMMNALSP